MLTKRLGRIYGTVAVILLNTVLMVVGGAFALEWMLDHRPGAGLAVTPSREIDLDSFKEVDATAARMIAAELDVYASSQPFGFNPWATFQQNPYDGNTISVAADPVLSHRRGPPPTEGRPRYVVWAFGGSTMFGWGVDDAHTLPALLQRELQARLPDRSVEVVNFGQPYWYSSSEVAAFLALLRARPAPDAAVFLDGLNDSAWVASGYGVPVFAGRAKAAWDRTRADAMRELPWLSVNASFPFKRVMDWLRYRGTLRPVPVEDPYRVEPKDQAQAILDTYRANRRLATNLASSQGVAALFFLQPVPWWGEWPGPGHANRDFPFGDKAQAAKAMEELAAEARSGTVSNFFTLHDALDGIDRPFVDGTHYSDAANRRLAVRMAEHILPVAVRR